jgi:hypothetical protein
VGWYIVIKTIKGHRYRYRQRTWRENGRMRTQSEFLGREDGGGRGSSKSNSASGAGNTETVGTATAPVLAGETEFIAALFDPENAASEWVPSWTRRYNANAKNFAINPRVFKIATAMGIAGTTRSWSGRSAMGGFMTDGAWYERMTDRLQMPDVTRFTSTAAFYLTFFHELAHATKTEGRLHRVPRAEIVEYGLEIYVEEEIVAELTAQIVTRRLALGDGAIDLSADYLQSYLMRCREPDEARAWAEHEALRAADYLVALWQNIEAPVSAEVTPTHKPRRALKRTARERPAPIERATLRAGKFTIPVGAGRASKPTRRSGSTKLETILKRRQVIAEKHAAGKLSKAQFIRQMDTNHAQYLRELAKQGEGGYD